MRVAVLGGSGRIGRDVLTWALAAGHEVAALARDPASLPGAAGLTVITGDATDAGAVAEVLAGADAVVSALGPRGAQTPGASGHSGQGDRHRHGKVGSASADLCLGGRGLH